MIAAPTPSTEWLARRTRHGEELAPLIAAYRDRRARAEVHPVHDFLFTYYPFPAGKLATWHPAFGESLTIEDDAQRELFAHKYYKHSKEETTLDPSHLREKDIARLQFSLSLLQATAARPPNFGCHGLHEWAMVYRSKDIRHRERAPLRLGESELAAFVESQPLACSHFDAFRFFTPAARPLNKLNPTLETRQDFEQPGCVHANMDLYKWAFKAMPWIGSDFLRKTFFLAMELRALDMRASPYDLSEYGYRPIPIETAAGRAEYAKEQQFHATRAARLRDELIFLLERLLIPLQATTASHHPP